MEINKDTQIYVVLSQINWSTESKVTMSRIQHIFLIEIFWCTKHESQDVQMHQKKLHDIYLFIFCWDINYLNFCLVILWISGFVINIVSYSSLLLLLFSSKFETFKRHQSQLAPLQIFHEFIISFVAMIMTCGGSLLNHSKCR